MNKYIGHGWQLCGVQEYRLTGGKGDGMRMLRVRNGKGLDFEISLDRCADIAMLSVDGINMSYIGPCGYVHPSYYIPQDSGFLKSFTAGFFTTCGLTAVGSPCIDDGEQCGLHGNISNTPSERYSVEETDEKIIIKAYIRDAALFSHQYVVEREYTVSKKENEIELRDKITNVSSSTHPIMLMYHCNMGYPLLSEKSKVVVPANSIKPRDARAAEGTQNSLVMEKPQKDFAEQCYYYDVKANDGIGSCGIYNPEIGNGLVMSFSKDSLDCFTEWKMMGEREYVLGLEPGNCTPDGRDVMREKGMLKFLNPDEEYKTYLKFSFIKSEQELPE